MLSSIIGPFNKESYRPTVIKQPLTAEPSRAVYQVVIYGFQSEKCAKINKVSFSTLVIRT